MAKEMKQTEVGRQYGWVHRLREGWRREESEDKGADEERKEGRK